MDKPLKEKQLTQYEIEVLDKFAKVINSDRVEKETNIFGEDEHWISVGLATIRTHVTIEQEERYLTVVGRDLQKDYHSISNPIKNPVQLLKHLEEIKYKLYE